jgi:hypothetical protein
MRLEKLNASTFDQSTINWINAMSEPIKRKPRPILLTQNAGSSSFKYGAALAIIAVVTLMALVPFVIAIFNAVAPVAGSGAMKMGRAKLSQAYLPQGVR